MHTKGTVKVTRGSMAKKIKIR